MIGLREAIEDEGLELRLVSVPMYLYTCSHTFYMSECSGSYLWQHINIM